jgi:hypothetical protein
MASVPSRALTNGRLSCLFPFLNWIGELRDSKVLHSDLIAGITVVPARVPGHSLDLGRIYAAFAGILR